MDFKLENGYESKTTFWSDFTIAESFGTNAVKDTFNTSFRNWKRNAEYVTELAIVTNLKCWHWYYKGNLELSRQYSDYYYKVRGWCLDHLKGQDLKYFIQTTD